MTEATVHVLPGVERRDIGPDIGPHKALTEAMSADLVDVVIVGRNKLGELFCASSLSNADWAVGMLMRAVTIIGGAEIVQIDDEPENTSA